MVPFSINRTPKGIIVSINDKEYRLFTPCETPLRAILDGINQKGKDLELIFRDSAVPEEGNSFIIKSNTATEISYLNRKQILPINKNKFKHLLRQELLNNPLNWIMSSAHLRYAYKYPESEEVHLLYEKERIKLLEHLKKEG